MPAAPHILVADDEPSIRMLLETGLALNGFAVTTARSGQEALEAASKSRFDAVLSDVYMPGGGGLDLLDDLRGVDASVPVLLMTAQGSVEAAVEAVSRGAADFIAKPFALADVVSLLRRHLSARQEALREHSADPEPDLMTSTGLIGRSGPMVLIYKLMAQAARADATVLVTGESGTGKELVARGIHRFSSRSARPFLSVNCSGLTDTLLESELFGYVRGSFTGANSDRQGLFEAADGGTLFLDELASTSAAFQASLLRVLQTGEVRRVGSTQMRRVDVRVIAASNASLRELVDAGEFRADLYYRLSVIGLELPPLRDRTGDVPLLTSHFLHRFGNTGEAAPYLTREAAGALSRHTWPGNVRELENALRRACAVAASGLITLDCLPPEVAAAAAGESDIRLPADHALLADRPSIDELEKRYLQLVLEETGWNRRRAAAVLGLDRRTIQRLIARYKLQGAESSDPDDEREVA